MHVRWQEMEPHFAARVRARLHHKIPPPDRLSPGWLAFAWVVSLLILTSYVGICFCMAGPIALVGVSVMPVALMGIALGPAYITARRNPDAPRHVLPARIPRVLLDESLRAVAETPAELLYAEILILLQKEEAKKTQLRFNNRVLRAQCAAFVAGGGANAQPHQQQAVLRELDSIRTTLLRRNPDAVAADITARQTDPENAAHIAFPNIRENDAEPIRNTIR